jgi:hypothetical protein
MDYHKLLKELVADREAASQAIRSMELARKSHRRGRPLGNK